MLRNWWRSWREVGGHWQNLGPYFRPLILRSFVTWFAMAPIVTKMMGQLPARLPLTLNGHQYEIILELPFTWWVLWFASLAYFLAYLIYASSVPRFVREFPNFAEFTAQQHSPRFLAWELARLWRADVEQKKLAERLIEKQIAKPITTSVPAINPRVEKRGTIFAFERAGQTYEVVTHDDDSNATQRELFWEIFARPAGSAPIRRNLIWLLVSLSFLLVFFVISQQVWSVLSYFYNLY